MLVVVPIALTFLANGSFILRGQCLFPFTAFPLSDRG
jgi:hypothetical protein